MQWQDVLEDASLKDLPYKIELNEWGNIEMSPASFIHSALQAEIARILGNQLNGRTFAELAIQTSHGVRVPDVAWGTTEYYEAHCHEVFASSAPEICIEIISPSNHGSEMNRKVALYLEAGAVEVWLIDEHRNIRVYNVNGLQDQSQFAVDLAEF